MLRLTGDVEGVGIGAATKVKLAFMGSKLLLQAASAGGRLRDRNGAGRWHSRYRS